MTMRRTDNGTGPAPPQAQRVPADQLLPDLALYERLIGEGVAELTRAAARWTTSPPGGWRSGWPPGRRNHPSPSGLALLHQHRSHPA